MPCTGRSLLTQFISRRTTIYGLAGGKKGKALAPATATATEAKKPTVAAKDKASAPATATEAKKPTVAAKDKEPAKDEDIEMTEGIDILHSCVF